MRLFRKKAAKFELKEDEYIVTPTWKFSTLADAIDAMETSRNRLLNRCMKEFGFIPNEIHFDKTSWLLGACLHMVHGSIMTGMWLPSDVDVISNNTVEPGTMMIANTYVRLCVMLSHGMLVRKVI